MCTIHLKQIHTRAFQWQIAPFETKDGGFFVFNSVVKPQNAF